MYRIYANGTILHDPLRVEEGLVVINPILSEKLNTHGSLRFSVAQNNPRYADIAPRKTFVKVVSDTQNNKYWFGRVTSVDRGWNGTKSVYCEGELSCLVDAVYQPFGFKGEPAVLFRRLMLHYIVTDIGATSGYLLRPGTVTVTDPNNYIVRSSKDPATLWSLLDSALFGTSLGGYVVPRYDKETDTHYVDYLADFDKISTQTVRFGENLLDFAEHVVADNVITVMYPYGADLPDTDPDYAPDPPENGSWNGNRLTIESVNNGHRDIENADGVALWGRIYGYKIWPEVTIASNLKSKAEAWLAQQIWQSITIEVSAVDLAFVDADIEQIQVGEYVNIESKPHDLKTMLLCTEKTTHLTQLQNSVIVLGAGIKTISDLQGSELKK